MKKELAMTSDIFAPSYPTTRPTLQKYITWTFNSVKIINYHVYICVQAIIVDDKETEIQYHIYRL
jgi:hypothetical protein